MHTEIKSNDQSIKTLDMIETDVTNLSQIVQLMRDKATNMQIIVGIQATDTSLVSAELTLKTFRKEGNTNSRSIILWLKKSTPFLKMIIRLVL